MGKCVICESLAGENQLVLPHDISDGVPDDPMARRRALLFLDHTTPDWEWFNAICLCQPCWVRLYRTCVFWAGNFTQPDEAEGLDLMVKVSRAGMPDEEALLLDDGSFTPEQVARIRGAKGCNATSRELTRIRKENAAPSPATGCKPPPPETGCEVIYLPNAKPRVRVRPGGPAGAVGRDSPPKGEQTPRNFKSGA